MINVIFTYKFNRDIRGYLDSVAWVQILDEIVCTFLGAYLYGKDMNQYVLPVMGIAQSVVTVEYADSIFAER